MESSRFRTFTRSARRKPQLWRLALGIVLIAAISVGLTLAMFVAAFALWQGNAGPSVFAGKISMANTPEGAFLLLSTTFGMGLGAFAAAVFAHGRSVGSLFGPATTVLRDFALSAGIAMAVITLSLGAWRVFYTPLPGLDLFVWISLLPLTLLTILVQTGSEEVLFRGYILQQLAARFPTRWVWMLGSAAIFGALHYFSSPSPTYGIISVLAAGFFGLLAADLTATTGSIGAAWGFHFANNTAAIALVAVRDQVPGLALWLTPYLGRDITLAETMSNFLIVGVIWWLIRKVLTR